MKLTKALPQIAARVLHNTRCVPQNMKFKLELIESAYGRSAVLLDFEKWCLDHAEDKFPFPITEYLRVIDQRLGSAPEEKRADVTDPHVAELASLAYELTSVLPSKASIAALLVDYPFEEIKSALEEYAGNLTEGEVKRAMREFFTGGGGAAVIIARRNRVKK